MKLWNRMGAGLGTIVFTVAAFGQGTTTPPPAATTCKTVPTALTAINLERVIPLADVLTTLTPNVPASTLASIAGGALEIHEKLIYNSQLGTVTSTLFLVPAGGPVPTPNFDFSTGVVQVTSFQVSQVLFGCSPVPSALLVGTATTTNGVYGAISSAPAAISIGYTTDNPPKINNVTEVLAGVAVAWSAGGTGTFTVTTPTSGGGTGPGTGPTIVVTAGPGTSSIPAQSIVQAASSPFLLDASGSTGSGALTYSWTTTSNSPVSFVGTSTPGQILVQFPSSGDYAIQLTVTDSTGAKSTYSLTLTFIGRPQ